MPLLEEPEGKANEASFTAVTECEESDLTERHTCTVSTGRALDPAQCAGPEDLAGLEGLRAAVL